MRCRSWPHNVRTQGSMGALSDLEAGTAGSQRGHSRQAELAAPRQSHKPPARRLSREQWGFHFHGLRSLTQMCTHLIIQWCTNNIASLMMCKNVFLFTPESTQRLALGRHYTTDYTLGPKTYIF